MKNFKNKILAEPNFFYWSLRSVWPIWSAFSREKPSSEARHTPCSPVPHEADGRRRGLRWGYSKVPTGESGVRERRVKTLSDGSPAPWKGTGMDSARQSTPDQQRSSVRRSISKFVRHLSCLVFVAGIVGPAGAASGPEWTIGRAVIQPAKEARPEQGLAVKLSLRNEGKPGETRVQILGRWKPGQDELTPLRRLKEEVALKQTVIVVISLERLAEVPPGNPLLELVVKTDARETDRKTVRLPHSGPND